jgi:hypothetical protein
MALDTGLHDTGSPDHRITPIVAIIALVTALLTGPITLLRLAAPGGPWNLLTLVAAAVALEALLTTRWLVGRQADDRRREVNPWLYRLAELVVLTVAMRFITWLAFDSLPHLASWRELLLHPSLILDLPFVLFTLLAILTWERATGLGTIFEALALSPSELSYYRRRARGETALPPLVKDRVALLQAYYHYWILGGVVLSFFAALTTFDLPIDEFLGGETFSLRNVSRLGLQPAMLVALLIYFTIGLWLASRGRIAVMRARWLAGEVEVDPSLERRWRRSSLLIILLAAALAAFLPIGSTNALGTIVQAGINLLVAVGALVLGLVTFFVSFLVRALGGDPAIDSPPTFEMPALPTAESPPPPGDSPAAFVIGFFYWLAIAAVAVLALLFFLRGRGVAIDGRWLVALWGRVTGWLGRLFRRAGAGAGLFSLALRNRLPRLGRGSGLPGRPWRYLRLNSLSPQEQIRFFYLAAVRRAGERGVPRGEAETPLEYAADLKASWPEAEEDLEALTEAFLAARYSRQEIRPDDASLVRRVWRRVRQALRKGTQRKKPTRS